MTFRYLDHASEVGVLAEGATAEEALAEAARGLFGIQVDRPALRPERFVAVAGTGADLGACLVDFLNGLLAAQDLEGLVFVEVSDLTLSAAGEGFTIEARAGGVAPARAAPHRLTEVKAVTYQGLIAAPSPAGYTVRFVADV
jgi:SHS2 domain-containing protein